METTNWNLAEHLKLSGRYLRTCTFHADVKLDLFKHLADNSCAPVRAGGAQAPSFGCGGQMVTWR